MTDIEKEVPKHKKKKKSSTSKSKTKSDHKHEYEDCLLITNRNPYKATYCKICGKIGDVALFDSTRLDNGYYRILQPDEVFEKYKHLEQFYIDDIFSQKYISK